MLCSVACESRRLFGILFQFVVKLIFFSQTFAKKLVSFSFFFDVVHLSATRKLHNVITTKDRNKRREKNTGIYILCGKVGQLYQKEKSIIQQLSLSLTIKIAKMKRKNRLRHVYLLSQCPTDTGSLPL